MIASQVMRLLYCLVYHWANETSLPTYIYSVRLHVEPVSVLHIKAFVLPVDIHHTQRPCCIFILQSRDVRHKLRILGRRLGQTSEIHIAKAAIMRLRYSKQKAVPYQRTWIPKYEAHKPAHRVNLLEYW